MISHEDAMRAALVEAERALSHGDVPVGAVVVHEGKIIASGCNEREKMQDPSAHAEVIALRKAAETLGRWRLDDCDLVVTLEPCVMCAGAALNARLRSVVFATHDPKAGAMGSRYNVASDPRLNHEVELLHGVLANQASLLLRRFFEERRDGRTIDSR
jgi:tRNA(adenine34) deaminase